MKRDDDQESLVVQKIESRIMPFNLGDIMRRSSAQVVNERVCLGDYREVGINFDRFKLDLRMMCFWRE